ncbi:MAG: MFS transporter [Chloroflexota bacterium]
MKPSTTSSKTPYYGWWIVAAAIVCHFAAVSLGQSIVSIFLKPVTSELGWQVWQFTLGPSLGLGVSALSGIVAGQIVDRRGPRILILVGVVVTVASFYGLGLQSSIWLYWLLNIIVGLLGWSLFGPLIVNSTLSKWFIKKRGWALAIGSIGVSLAGLITPLVMTSVVDTVGWRNGYYILAIFTFIVVTPMAFVMRRTPEDYGLMPDGEAPSISDTSQQLSVVETHSLTKREAVRTSSFWLLVVGFGFNMAALSSVLFHAIPFATDANFTRGIAALALTINGLGNLLSKAVWGYSLQRFDAKNLVITAFSVSSLGVALMLLAATTGQVVLLFIGFFLYGFGFGGTIPLGEFLWVSYFGRANIGAIRGIAQPLTFLGPTFGPVLIGVWYDYAASYQLAFVTIILVYWMGALLVWFSQKPTVRPVVVN